MDKFTTAGNRSISLLEESINDATSEVKKARELYVDGLAKVAYWQEIKIIASPLIQGDEFYMMTSEAFAEEINKAIQELSTNNQTEKT